MSGFESELLIFRVSKEHLRPGMRLGRGKTTQESSCLTDNLNKMVDVS